MVLCVVVRVAVRVVVLGVHVVVCVVRVVGRMVVVVVASRARGSSHFGLSRCGPAGFSFPTHPTLEMSLRGLKRIHDPTHLLRRNHSERSQA